ncbi:hypothetical protein ACQPYE_01055 [Actinosynnema sp. CA-299493]
MAESTTLPLPPASIGETQAMWLVTPEEAGKVLLLADELDALLRSVGRLPHDQAGRAPGSRGAVGSRRVRRRHAGHLTREVAVQAADAMGSALDAAAAEYDNEKRARRALSA